MRRYLPLSAFEHDSQAVIAADYDGTIRLCNHAASRLLGVVPAAALSRRCWALGAFRGPDGSAFCGPVCPVRHAASEGQAGVRHRVLAGRGPSAGQPLELISFLVPSSHGDRCGVVHFVRPLAAVSAIADRNGPFRRGEIAAHALTAREREVLQLIAAGLTTRRVASTLGIRTTTVRNHVGHILRKLGVHRRIEAVVLSTMHGGTVDPVEEPIPPDRGHR